MKMETLTFGSWRD